MNVRLSVLEHGFSTFSFISKLGIAFNQVYRLLRFPTQSCLEVSYLEYPVAVGKTEHFVPEMQRSYSLYIANPALNRFHSRKLGPHRVL
jgi:hypothetical protein